MKKYLLALLFFVGITNYTHAQQGSEKTGGFLSRLFGKSNSKRSQMHHFDKRKKDPNIKHNGTAYRRFRKRSYKVDGDGFSSSSQGKRRRGKKSGVK